MVRPAGDHIDESPNGDAPEPRRHLAATAPAARTTPHRDERVLQCLGHDVGIAAPAPQPDLQPGGVPSVQSGERIALTSRDRHQQRGIGRVRRVGAGGAEIRHAIDAVTHAGPLNSSQSVCPG
jgi:hypothetical protein